MYVGDRKYMRETENAWGKLDEIVPEQDPWAGIQNKAAQPAGVQVEGISETVDQEDTPTSDSICPGKPGGGRLAQEH